MTRSDHLVHTIAVVVMSVECRFIRIAGLTPSPRLFVMTDSPGTSLFCQALSLLCVCTFLSGWLGKARQPGLMYVLCLSVMTKIVTSVRMEGPRSPCIQSAQLVPIITGVLSLDDDLTHLVGMAGRSEVAWSIIRPILTGYAV